jgi:putative transposase
LYVAYPISYRQLEKMMEEHGVEVDHATLNRWVIKYVPLLERQFRACRHPAGPSWRMDETYVRVKVTRKYLYRAVDRAGATVDFPADRQTGPQSRVAILAQGDQVEWDA